MAALLPNAEVRPGTPEWAGFDDWIRRRLGAGCDWTVVAEAQDYSGLRQHRYNERRATHSYLVRNDPSILKGVFECDGWDVHFEHGGVSFDGQDHGVSCHEELGDESSRVFIRLRRELGPHPAAWELWPTFVLYFDLRAGHDGALIDPYTEEEVARVPYPASSGPVEIRTYYLQDYLSARDMVLVRQHDHRRHWFQKIAGVVPPETDSQVLQTQWGCYWLHVNDEPTPVGRFSRLVAKDFIPPSGKAGIVGGIRSGKPRADEYPEYLVLGSDGAESHLRPNAGDILHPAWFNPKVLQRYYDAPNRYTVQFTEPGLGLVRYLDKWVLPIGRNNDGLIVIWLGDLAKQGLSYEEMVHWRTHNVRPSGGMAEDFWNAQMECKVSSDASTEDRILTARARLERAFKQRGKPVFEPLKGPDRHLKKRVRTPLSDDHWELTEILQTLDRLFVEYLNAELFSCELPRDRTIDSRGKRLKSIALFENWLADVVSVPPDIVRRVRDSLRTLHDARSKIGGAHRFSNGSYQEVIAKLGLKEQVTSRVLFERIAVSLADALDCLANNLEGVKLPRRRGQVKRKE
jgi:hypothetical protein